MREADDIERLFQDSFEGFEATPPASVKTAIDKEISGGNQRLWWLLALALLLTTTVVGFLVYPSSKGHTAKNQTIAQDYTKQGRSDNSENSSSNSNSLHSSTKQSSSTSSIDKTTSNSDAKQANHSATSANNSPKAGNPSAKNNAVNHSKSTAKSGTTSNPAAKKMSPPGKYPKKKTTPKAITNPTNKKLPQVQQPKTNKVKASGDGNESSALSDQLKAEAKKEKMLQEQQKKDSLAKVQKELELAEKAKKDSLDKVAAVEKAEKAKQDSIAAVKAKEDSISNAQLAAANKGNNKKDKLGDTNWMVSLYVGPQFDWKSATDYKQLSVNPSFRVSGEMNRTLFSGYGLTSGLGYNKMTETYSISTFTVDSTFSHMDSTAIWNQNMDSIIGYNVYPVYNVDSTEEVHPTAYQTSSIFLPIYLTKRFEFSDTWGMLVQAGAVVSFNKITGGSTLPLEPEPIQNRTGILISTRVHAMYRWNDWMFSAGFNGGWYLKPPLTYTDYKGARYFFSPQFGIHYTF